MPTVDEWEDNTGGHQTTGMRAGTCSPTIPDTAGTGCWSPGDPFLDVQPNATYWSSTSFNTDPTVAWDLDTSGFIRRDPKGSNTWGGRSARRPMMGPLVT